MILDFNTPITADSKSEWLTPPEVIAALGEFDLDPCAPINRPSGWLASSCLRDIRSPNVATGC